MNHKESFLAMLKDSGFDYRTEPTSQQGNEHIVLESKVGNVGGYTGFQAWFEFDANGKLVSIDIGE